MFYIKIRTANGTVIKTDITDKNVFTCCPKCGKELPVDLAEFFSDGEGDLFSSGIICSACAKEHKKRRFLDDCNITIDGLALLSDVLCQTGYGEQVQQVLYDHFMVESVGDLKPDQYRSYANALIDLAKDGGDL